MEMYTVKRVAEKVEIVDEGAIMPLADAARELGCSLPVINSMLYRGTLPWLQLMPNVEVGVNVKHYTLRDAVLAVKNAKKLRQKRL